MEEERKKDYTSGYEVSIDPDAGAFTEYNTGTAAKVTLNRKRSDPKAQLVLAAVCAAAGAVYLHSFLSPAFRVKLEALSPWNTIASAVMFIASLLISSAGENRPMQLWLVSACIPAFHYLMVWALNKASGTFLFILLGVLFLLPAVSMVFAMDHRVVGRNEFPFIAALLPMYLLSFSYAGGLSEYAPAWYGKLLAFAQGLVMANAALSTLRHLLKRKDR